MFKNWRKRSNRGVSTVRGAVRKSFGRGFETLERRTLMAADAAVGSAWQNQVLPTDVNGDGKVSPIDALIVINQINSGGSTALATSTIGKPSAFWLTPGGHYGSSPIVGLNNAKQQPFYFDVSGDKLLSPLDALIIINALNDPGPSVQLSLRATDLNGLPITAIGVGQPFKLNAYTKDLRTSGATGVYSAYLDAAYDPTHATIAIDAVKDPANEITFGPNYTNSHTGSVATPGLVDEAGGSANLLALGPAEQLLWTVIVNPTAVGPLDFAAQPASDPFSEVALYGDAIVPFDQIAYVGTTVQVNPPGASLVISDATAAEGNAGVANLTFTVTLSSTDPITQPVTVQYATQNGSAAAPDDFSATAGALTFAVGETSKTITVPVNGDFLVEPDEAFFVNLTNSNNAAIADGQGIGTITNDDTAQTLSISDVQLVEGNSGSTDAIFTVTLSIAPGQGQQVTVGYATQDNTATAVDDYSARTGNLTFAFGETTKQIVVPVLGDTNVEGDETFFVNLTSSTGPGGAPVPFADSQGIATIIDDEGVSISDAVISEGNTGTTTANFVVSLPVATTQILLLTYSTADSAGVDSATAGSDYIAQSGTITFNPGDSSKIISVLVNGDLTVENNETFVVNLSGSAGVKFANSQGVGTILNDDTAGGGGNTARVKYRLDVVDSGGVPVDALDVGANFVLNVYASDLRVIAPNQAGVFAGYLDILYSSSLVVATGPIVYGANYPSVQSPTGGLITTPGVVDEGGATYDKVTPLGPGEKLLFSVPFRTVASGLVNFMPDPADVLPAHYTLVFGDNDPVLPGEIMYTGDTLQIGANFFAITPAVSVTEGNAGFVDATFTISRTLGNNMPATVQYVIAGITASTPADFTASPLTGTLTFAPGDSQQTVTVQVRGDLLDESNETFSVTLQNAVNGALGDATGIGTIIDDDAPPTVSIADAMGPEGTSLSFVVTLSAPSGLPVTVVYATAASTSGNIATSGTDFTPANGTLTFAAGETSKTISVAAIADMTVEPDETFVVNLSAPGNATIADGTAVGTIQNVVPTSLSGTVYVDLNADGVKNANEVGIQNVTVELIQNNVVVQTTTTAADGKYSFIVQPGTYTLHEVQPGFFVDGRDTPGTPAPTTTTNDRFVGITIAPLQSGTGFNFGEAGLRPEFVATFFDRRAFFASSIITHIYGPAVPVTGPSTGSLNLQQGDVFISFDNGWSGLRTISADFLSAKGSVTLTLYDNNLKVVAVSPTQKDHAELSFEGTPGKNYFLRVSGSNTDVTLTVKDTPPVMMAAAAQQREQAFASNDLF